jgi:alpha-galactosidase
MFFLLVALAFASVPLRLGLASELRNRDSAGRSAPSVYASDALIEAPPVSEDFVPDGNLDKPDWQRTKWVEFDHDMPGVQHYPDERTRVAAMWSQRFVYFGFICHYVVLNTYEGEDIKEERWELWNRDVAEVFLNPEPQRVNHYFEFEVAPNNQWIDLEIDKDKTPFNDAGWNSGYEHGTRIDAARHVWTCEMRIPVDSMKVSAMPPDHDWRLNLFRASGAGDDTRRHFMAWSTIPSGTTFHVPTRFGILRFVK